MGMNVDFSRRIDKLREIYAGEDIYKTACQYMVACLPLLREFYTEKVPRRAFELACQYWGEGSVSEEELSKILDDCWDYSDAVPHTEGDFSLEYWAVRALMLCLYPTESDDDDQDTAEQMTFFLLYATWAHGWDEKFESEAYRFFPRLRDV